MVHILTDDEAIGALRINAKTDVPNLEMLLSAVDDGIKAETGHDWAADQKIDPTAKIAAMLLLISFNEGLPTPAAYGYKIIQLDAKVKNGEVK